MGILALVRMSAQLDLGILSLLVQPIKHDLGLSDGEIGLLLGFAFALFYLGLGVPLAKLVDSMSRRTILAVGITVWSLMTALCGLAQNFAQLFLFRAGVGAGESVNGPATYSMIADLFPRERLARAIAVLNIGSVTGTGLSLIFGAVVIGALAHMEMPHLPLIGQPRHWQAVLFLVGLPGLVCALLMLTVPEPARRGGRSKPASFAGILRFMRGNWRLFLPLFLALLLGAMESGGSTMWRPAFLQRSYGWSAQAVGLITGITSIVTSAAGVFIGSFLSERLARKHDQANLIVVLIGWTLATPCMIVAPLMPDGTGSMIFIGMAAVTAAMGAPTQNAALQSIVPNRMRGQITALYLLTYTLAAQGLGPSFIAAITQWIVRDEAGLRYALSGSAAVIMPLAIVTMIFGLRPYARAIAGLKAQEGAA